MLCAPQQVGSPLNPPTAAGMLVVSHSGTAMGAGALAPLTPPNTGICSNQAQLICHRRDGDGHLGVIAGDQSLSPNQLSPAWDHLTHRHLGGCPHHQPHAGSFAHSWGSPGGSDCCCWELHHLDMLQAPDHPVTCQTFLPLLSLAGENTGRSTPA